MLSLFSCNTGNRCDRVKGLAYVTSAICSGIIVVIFGRSHLGHSDMFRDFQFAKEPK